MLYKAKIERAIEIADTLDQLEYVKEKLQTTDQINRRTKIGRELSQTLLAKIENKERLLIINGATPF